MFFVWSKYHQLKFVNKNIFYYFVSRQISTRLEHALNDLSISLISVSPKFLLRSAGVLLASTNFILMQVSTPISSAWTPSPQFLLFIEMEVTGMVRHHPCISFLIYDLHQYNGRKERHAILVGNVIGGDLSVPLGPPFMKIISSLIFFDHT